MFRESRIRLQTIHYIHATKGEITGTIAHAMVIALYQSKSRWLGVKISTGLGGKRCDISEHITELIKQLLKLYEGLTERYGERVNWLEKDRDDNSFR